MEKKSYLGILLFGLVWVVAAKAISVPFLYQVQVPVKTSENGERTDALRRAFQEVLWRVTGNAKTLETPAVQHALTEVEQYLQQYRYISAPDSLLLQVDWNSVKLKTLIQNAQLSSGLTENLVIPSSPAPSQEFFITVIDLQSIVDLETAKAVIKQIPSVSSVTPSLINQTEVSFKVVGQGDKKTIKEDLRLKEHLMEVDSDGTMEQELVYRWVP